MNGKTEKLKDRKTEELLRLAEGVYLDFKEGLPHPDDLAKLLVAFSNTKGGKIIIGVIDKDRKVKGLKLDLNVEEYVMNIASNNCCPIISPSVEFITYQMQNDTINDAINGIKL